MTPLERRNYYNDPRTHAAFRTKRVKVLERVTSMSAKIEVDLGEETRTFTVPVVYTLCDLCRGHGEVVNPGIDAGGLTQDDFDRDPGLREAYFEGRYNETCPECSGQRVTVDQDALLTHLPAEVQIVLTELVDDDEDFLRVQMAELAFGC